MRSRKVRSNSKQFPMAPAGVERHFQNKIGSVVERVVRDGGPANRVGRCVVKAAAGSGRANEFVDREIVASRIQSLRVLS